MSEATIIVEDLPSKDPVAKVKLFTVSGQLDETNVDTKAKDIYKVFDENPGKLSLIFDFAGLDYMNSKSIGYLTDWYGKTAEKGGKIVIARAKPNIKDILQVVGLTQLINVFDSLDEAKLSISNVAPSAALPGTAAGASPSTLQAASPQVTPEGTYKLNT